MNSRPRIAIVCRACGGQGSVAGIALHHARLLADEFEVLLFSESLPDVLPTGVTGIRVGAPDFRWLRRYAHVPADIAFCRAARRAIEREHARRSIAAIECHAHSVALITGKPLQRRLGLKLVMVTHGDIHERPPGTYDGRLTRYYRYVTPRAYRVVDRVIALSPPMADLALAGGASRDAVKLIPNGVAPTDIGLDPAEADDWPERSRLELLFVGRLAPEKGVDTLIEGLVRAISEGVDIGLRVAGSGPLEAQLHALVLKKGMEKHVAFLGAVTRANLASHYRSADVVCVPSRSDPLPTVAIEAMWCGRPILASDAGGLPFMVGNDAGLVFPAGSTSAIAEKLVFLAKNKETLRTMGKAARVRAEGSFAWNVIAPLLCRELHAVAGSPPGRSRQAAENERRD
jgi:glycosyltransferase involved in cell wall biosynthesis